LLRVEGDEREANAEPAYAEGFGVAGGSSKRSEEKIALRRPSSCGILVVVSSVLSQDPEILGGEPVFAGTRVPVKNLFDHLEAGDSIEQFLERFPSVKREQVVALLEEARDHALSAP
jgi:uncharacterized protein (DUF433 family)